MDDKKNLTPKDFNYIIGILLGIIALLVLTIFGVISLRLSDNQDMVNIVSIGSGLISITLGVVAIIISVLQNNSTGSLNQRMNETLGRMDEKLNNVREKLDINNNNKVATNSDPKSIIGNGGYTRIHIILGTAMVMDIEKTVIKLKEIFNEQYDAKVIDYSAYTDAKTPCTTNLFFIVDKQINNTETLNVLNKLLNEDLKSFEYNINTVFI